MRVSAVLRSTIAVRTMDEGSLDAIFASGALSFFFFAVIAVIRGCAVQQESR